LIIKQLQHNIKPAKRTDNDIKYIVIHDTQNYNKYANALANFNYFNTERDTSKSSCDYIVDSSGIIKANDHRQYYTYHCGDGKGQYGITNGNSIGIEMCVNADGDFPKTLANTAVLVKSLQEQFPHAKVVRHYDASRKMCPRTLSANNWEGWTAFLNLVRGERVKLSWKNILQKSVDSPDRWEKAINSVIDRDMGDLSILEFLPILIEKVWYTAKKS
jgi:N-acetylmuramoyl-L-alanine amidase